MGGKASGMAPLILLMVLGVSPSVSYNTTWSPPACGVPVVSGQAAEGTDALDGQWPWQVSVWYSGSRICGGSLISSQWVLSAAHCFINSDKPHYSIHLGRDHLTAGGNLTAQVSDIIRHPQYTDPGGRGDIALLKLSSPVTYTPDILPICLPPAAATFPCGMEGWVTGWGNTSIQGNREYPKSFEKVKTFLIDRTRCEGLYGGSSSSNVSTIPDDRICSHCRGLCQRDFGGALMYEAQGVWYQAGVISWGFGCTSIDRPAVYTMVPTYISWIQSYVPELPQNLGSISNPTIDCDRSYRPSSATNVSSLPLDSRAASSVCGSPLVSSRIVGGTAAVPGEWPWQVHVRHCLFSSCSVCGGSLIAPQWVMSAAHCVDFDITPYYYTVYLGAHKLKDLDANVVISGVQRIVYHPQYTSVGSGGDIALLKLSSPVTYTKYIMPICLPSVTFPCGMECWVTGWGRINTEVSLPDPRTLQKVTAQLIDRTECDKMYHEGSPVSSSQRIILDDMMCAGYKEGLRGTCQGDSGGPLVCKVRGVWYEVGIVSWGAKCGQPRKPTVYTQVTSYQSWIRNYIPDITFTEVTNIPEPSVKCSGSLCLPDPAWTLLTLLTWILSSM
ncbi:transmembrane protease serine 9-like [Dendropsophus ebraccatus]|uniref:transmembrane protease serine 9-like n=1 Tax=Dendropsophus ebraccatus TaxID=150705 RepID=UPI0038314E4B